MNIHVPAQRPAPDQAAAPAAPAPEAVAPGWGRVLRVTVARASLAMVVALVIWSVLPLLAGWTPRVILSGSMEPRIHVGDIVVTRTVPGASVTKGQVITVKDPDHPAKTRTHRVLRRASDGTIVTKGDANPQADSSHISNENVLGLGVVRVPYVGRPAYWMAEQNWLALGATTLFLGWCMVTVLPGSRKPEDTDGDDQNGPSGVTRRYARSRRAAATVAVAAMVVGAATGPAEAAFKRVAANPASVWSAAASFGGYSDSVLADSPQFYWRLGESSGTSAADAKNGRTGQVTGTYTWGKSGAIARQSSETALGVDGGYVNQPTSLSSGTAFSVETWLKTTRSTGGGLVSLITGTGPERSLYMGADGKVRFGRNGTALVTSTTALNDGSWHHVVYTNAGSGSVRAKLYVDGALVAQSATGVTATTSGNWRAGQAQWSGNWPGTPDQYFRGDLDEVAVYGTTLTAQRVTAHYAS
ncbi:signal peptidase I [Marmoricola sp. URHB0036]|uniref:signal peptidase I n=1 Tax=Marmoricola sp. URHB0036 TaxID=1298863 RepID=UPI0004036EA6|nr:signal peptidase I [Marmoricola sp. URHB0036]